MFMDKHADYHHNSGVCPLIACIVLSVFLRWPFTHNDSPFISLDLSLPGEMQANLLQFNLNTNKLCQAVLQKDFAPIGFIFNWP